MMIGNWKEQGLLLKKIPTPSEKRLTGFEPGLLGQNPVALPLAPPPLPMKLILTLNMRGLDQMEEFFSLVGY